MESSKQEDLTYVYPVWTRIMAISSVFIVSGLSLWLVTAAILKISGVTE